MHTDVEQRVGELLRSRNLTLSTAESCTGGTIAARITSMPGSSVYFKGGIVAYANEVKETLLRVSPGTLEKYGAVSKETVEEMVKGAMKVLNTDFAVATSGIAGPGGGTKDKPVGTVWMAAGCAEKIVTRRIEKNEGRVKNIRNASEQALQMLEELLK